jgi:hypothetical protein
MTEAEFDTDTDTDTKPDTGLVLEQGMLSLAMSSCDTSMVRDALASLSPGMWRSPGRRAIYEAVMALLDEGTTPDDGLVMSRLDECYRGAVDACLRIAPMLSQAEPYAREIRARWVARTSVRVARAMVDDLEADPSDMGPAIRAVARLQDIAEDVSAEPGLPRMVLCEHTPEALDLWLPLDLSERVRLLPGSIITIAGETNAGKTALLLNMAWQNAPSWPITRYLTSEMPVEELTERCVNIATRESWDAVHFHSCVEDFAKWLAPDGLNIIDYMEPPKGEAFQMPASFRAVYDALGKGIAVVAIQKRTGNPFGVGGEGTTEKARLAISLSKAATLPDGVVVSAKVTKCKAYRRGQNVDGKTLFFEVTHGAKLSWDRLVEQGAVTHRGWRWYNRKAEESAMKRLQEFARDECEGNPRRKADWGYCPD